MFAKGPGGRADIERGLDPEDCFRGGNLRGIIQRLPSRTWSSTIRGTSSQSRRDDPVFRMNNPNVPEHKAAAVYNFTPNIANFRDREQTLTYALGDLDDINTAGVPKVFDHALLRL